MPTGRICAATGAPDHALQERGYGQGQNIAFEYRAAEERADRLRDLAVDLTRPNVGAVSALSSTAVRAPANATRTQGIE